MRKKSQITKNVCPVRPKFMGKRRTKKHPALTRAQKKLVEENLWVAGYVAHRTNCAKWGNTGALAMEDLVQVARFALCVASIQYNPDQGVKFSTYAFHKAKGYLSHALRDKSRMVRTPRWVESMRNKVKDGLAKNKTYAEIAEELGVEEEKVVICHMAETNYHVSYDSSPDDWTTPEFLHEDCEVKSSLSCPEMKDLLKKFSEEEIDLLVKFSEDPSYLTREEMEWAAEKFHELKSIAYGQDPARFDRKTSQNGIPDPERE